MMDSVLRWNNKSFVMRILGIFVWVALPFWVAAKGDPRYSASTIPATMKEGMYAVVRDDLPDLKF